MAKLIDIKLYKATEVILNNELEDELAEYIHDSHTSCGDDLCEDAGGGIWDEAGEAMEAIGKDNGDIFKDTYYDFLASVNFYWEEQRWQYQSTKQLGKRR